jgi:hypothetical protein
MSNPKFIRTKNYDLFSFFHSNREVNKSHVNNLKESIQEHGLLQEIIVNENYQIVDGQNRFVALQELGLDIEAIVKPGTDEDSVITTNVVRKGWSLTDYIYHYASKGNADYVRLVQLLEENDTRIGTNTLVEMYGKGAYKPTRMRNGEYKIDIEKGKRLTEIVVAIEPYVPMYGFTRRFILPLIQIVLNNDNFQLNRMIGSLQRYKVSVYPNTTDTRNGLVDTYNRRLTGKNRIS